MSVFGGAGGAGAGAAYLLQLQGGLAPSDEAQPRGYLIQCCLESHHFLPQGIKGSQTRGSSVHQDARLCLLASKACEPHQSLAGPALGLVAGCL